MLDVFYAFKLKTLHPNLFKLNDNSVQLHSEKLEAPSHSQSLLNRTDLLLTVTPLTSPTSDIMKHIGTLGNI